MDKLFLFCNINGGSAMLMDLSPEWDFCLEFSKSLLVKISPGSVWAAAWTDAPGMCLKRSPLTGHGWLMELSFFSERSCGLGLGDIYWWVSLWMTQGTPPITFGWVLEGFIWLGLRLPLLTALGRGSWEVQLAARIVFWNCICYLLSLCFNPDMEFCF